jgi:hypothetical protein
MWNHLALYRDNKELHTGFSAGGLLISSTQIKIPKNDNEGSDSGSNHSDESDASSRSREGWARFDDLALENFHPIGDLFKNNKSDKAARPRPKQKTDKFVKPEMKKAFSVPSEQQPCEEIRSNDSSSCASGSSSGGASTSSDSSESHISNHPQSWTKWIFGGYADPQLCENSVLLEFKPLQVDSDISLSPMSSASGSDSNNSVHLRCAAERNQIIKEITMKRGSNNRRKKGEILGKERQRSTCLTRLLNPKVREKNRASFPIGESSTDDFQSSNGSKIGNILGKERQRNPCLNRLLNPKVEEKNRASFTIRESTSNDYQLSYGQKLRMHSTSDDYQSSNGSKKGLGLTRLLNPKVEEKNRASFTIRESTLNDCQSAYSSKKENILGKERQRNPCLNRLLNPKVEEKNRASFPFAESTSNGNQSAVDHR